MRRAAKSQQPAQVCNLGACDWVAMLAHEAVPAAVIVPQVAQRQSALSRRAVLLMMNGNRAGRVNHAIATPPRPQTKIYVLIIQKEAGIEPAEMLPHGTPD